MMVRFWLSLGYPSTQYNWVLFNAYPQKDHHLHNLPHGLEIWVWLALLFHARQLHEMQFES